MEFKLVQVYDNYVSAHIAKGRLEEEGIHCWLKDENTVTLDPILTNALGGIKLMVETPRSEEAAAILRMIDNEIKKAHPCPKCNSLNVELVSTPRKISNWLSFISFGFFASYAPKIDMVYHCFDCSHEYPAEDKKDDAGDKS